MRRLLIAATVAAALGGCGATTTEETAAAPAADVNVAEGSALAGGAAPAFAPEYPGGEVVTSISAVEDGRPGGIFGFRTGDPPAKVLAYYRDKAVAAGLKAAPTAAAEQIFMAQGETGELAVTATPVDGATHAQVTWATR